MVIGILAMMWMASGYVLARFVETGNWGFLLWGALGLGASFIWTGLATESEIV